MENRTDLKRAAQALYLTLWLIFLRAQSVFQKLEDYAVSRHSNIVSVFRDFDKDQVNGQVGHGLHRHCHRTPCPVGGDGPRRADVCNEYPTSGIKGSDQ